MTKQTMNSTLATKNIKPSLIKHKLLKIKKTFSIFYIQRADKLRDLVLFFALTFGMFLPVRWFFYGYVTHNVLPNMGMVTLIAVIMFLLVRSGWLGPVGRAFDRQMRRFVASRKFRRIFIFSIALSLYTGIPLYFIERGEFHYNDEIELFEANSIRSAYLRDLVATTTDPIFEEGTHKQFMSNIDFCEIRPDECILVYDDLKYEDYSNVMLGEKMPSRETIDILNNMTLMESYAFNVEMANNYDFLMSGAMHLANESSDGWTGHFSTVWFVEEIEAVGLYFLYRRWYLKKTGVEPWLGIFDNNLKRIMYKTKKGDKFYKGRSTRPEDKKTINRGMGLVMIGIVFIAIRFAIDEPIFGAFGLVTIAVSIAYTLRSQRRSKHA